MMKNEQVQSHNVPGISPDGMPAPTGRDSKQGEYGAFSVSQSNVEQVKAYIANQE